MCYVKRQTRLSLGTTFLYIGRTVFEKGVVLVVLEICFSNKH